MGVVDGGEASVADGGIVVEEAERFGDVSGLIVVLFLGLYRTYGDGTWLRFAYELCFGASSKVS